MRSLSNSTSNAPPLLSELHKAESLASNLFKRIEGLKLIQVGRTEEAVNDDIYALAAKEFGVEKHWHKRIVRAGKNTLCPYDENPPNLTIQEDDVVFIDLGPVFEAWEADFGRSYALGTDPVKHQLVADGEECWHLAKAHFDATPDLNAAQMFAFVKCLAAERGWQLGQWHSGHLIGNFPHDRPPEKVHNFIMPGNDEPLAYRDWILEVHITNGEFGAFFEQLLT